MHECLRKHSCMSSICYSHTKWSFFPTVNYRCTKTNRCEMAVRAEALVTLYKLNYFGMGSLDSDGGGDLSLLSGAHVGDHVAALHSTDGCWYRGTVLEVPSPGHYTVFFLDYGNQDTCTIIAALPQHVLDIPVQAVSCVLSTITHTSVINYM